jgi:hypothetical protein
LAAADLGRSEVQRDSLAGVDADINHDVPFPELTIPE